MVSRRLWSLFALLIPAKSSWTEKLDHGSVSGFPSYDEANALLETFVQQHPNELVKKQIGSSYQKRPIVAYVLTSRRQEVPQVLMTALTHAREPAGLTVLLYFLGHLLEKFVQGDAEAKYIVEMREIWFVPFVNPDGYVANQGLRSKVIRKNRRPTCRSAVNGGVDLNRNFGTHWSGSFDGCNEEHGGQKPFSEPETQALKKICEENNFKAALNFHAFGSMLTHPYNWANTDLLPASDRAVYKEIAKVFGYKKFGTAIETVGYTTTGESDDWMYSSRHIISMSPEVGPERGGFWPPRSEIAGINSRNFDRTRYVVLKAGMELKVEGVYQSAEEFLKGGLWQGNLPGGLPEKVLKLRISNLGLSSSSGKVLRAAVQGVAQGTPGDPGMLVHSDGQSSMLTPMNGSVSFEVGAIEKRASRVVWILPARLWQPGQLLTCVAEGPDQRPPCHCYSSGRESFALPDSSRTGRSSLCSAAWKGSQGSPAPTFTETHMASTSRTVTELATEAPFFQIATTALPLTNLVSGNSASQRGSSGHGKQEETSAIWLLLSLGVTFMGMFACLFLQSFIVPRAVAKRAPSALDYERIPGLQVRPEEDSDDLGFSPQAPT